MKRVNGLSLNLERNNIDKIKELFPEAVEEGKIDFDMLRAMLGDEVDDSRERYQFTWNGKAIGELSPRTVIFNEAGFNNDNDKINAVYNLEKTGVEDVKCI